MRNSLNLSKVVQTNMKGWNGKILRVNLTKRKVATQESDSKFAQNWLGGRGFAVKILWDELDPELTS